MKKDIGQPKSDESSKPETRIYWAGAKGYRIANFQPEIKQGGNIVQAEQPLVIHGHVLQTDNLKKIAFIEKSNAFQAGRIKRVDSLAEAQKLTTALQHRESQVQQVNTDEVIENPTEAGIATVAGADMGAG